MKYPTWQIGTAAPAAVDALQREGIPVLLAHILAARGFDTPALAMEFLHSVEAPLPDPLLMRDMRPARDRVRLALERRERICVFGDYDVDGITATCLLVEYLRSSGGDVTSYIPGRLDEGYGLSNAALELLRDEGVRLVITVDCGITAIEEAAFCREIGIDLVITDHHACGSELPDAIAVVDPHRPDDSYPFKGLAGVGVAFKLAAAVEGEQEQLLGRFCDLLAMGTVADVMPLLEENRAIVCQGIDALRQHPRVGILALLGQSSASAQTITTTTIGYILAPRINAAGRMGQVPVALQLLMTSDPIEAAALATTLCGLNKERQNIEQSIYAAARKMIGSQKPDVIVLADSHWHQGVVGIVASRLSEEYKCPACLICLDGEVGKASSRSYGGFPIIDALRELAPLLERYGGHQLAAGFTIRKDNIDAFRQALAERVRAYRAQGAAEPALQLDCCVDDPRLLTLEQVEALSALEPCGTECPRPMVCIRGLSVSQAGEVGGGKHLRMRLMLGDLPINAIFFSMTSAKAGVAPGDVIDVAGLPQINEYRGVRSVQLQLVDLRPADAERSACQTELALYQRQREGGALTPTEAAELLPSRADFVALWRYLKANAIDSSLLEHPDCLARKLSRCTGQPVSYMRTRVCLDVFQECGLLGIRRKQEQYEILIKATNGRVDLNTSHIMMRLQAYCKGE